MNRSVCRSLTIVPRIICTQIWYEVRLILIILRFRTFASFELNRKINVLLFQRCMVMRQFNFSYKWVKHDYSLPRPYAVICGRFNITVNWDYLHAQNQGKLATVCLHRFSSIFESIIAFICLVCLVWLFTSHQQSSIKQGRVFLCWTSTKLG